MKSIKILILTLPLIYFLGCDTVDSGNASGDWLVPKDQVFDGGPGRDGIPSIDNPEFTNIDDASYLLDDDLVIGISEGATIKAYPHPILDWHEVVNDGANNKDFTITYCPLTGSAIMWMRNGPLSATTFGVSGLLYNSNLIPYDRETRSNWSQMRLQCVNGPLIGTEIQTGKIVETTYKTWKEMFPSSKLLSTNTGFARQYGVYPYGTYKSDDELIFPVSNEDNRLPKKTRVLGLIVGNETIAFPVNNFKQGVDIQNISFGGEKFVVAGSSDKNFAVAFKSKLSDGAELQFTAVQNELPIIMVDGEGNKWDIFGRVTAGPRSGQSLDQAKAFIAYWFAWAAFYPNSLISQ